MEVEQHQSNFILGDRVVDDSAPRNSWILGRTLKDGVRRKRSDEHPYLNQDLSTNSVCSLKLKAKLTLNFYSRQTLHIL